MIQFGCPGCAQGFKIKPEHAGKKVKCPRCGQVVQVPGETAPPAAARDATVKRELADRSTRAGQADSARRNAEAPTEYFGRPRTEAPARPEATGRVNRGDATVALDSEDDQRLTEFLAPPQQPDEIGRLGTYRILKVLGTGGMGVVFKAEDLRLERLVAIKAMLPGIAANASARKRFLREAKAAAAINHRHIVTIHQVDEDRGVPFLAMEFLQGEPLDARLNRERKLPQAQVIRIGREMAEGLAAAHQRGLIHRDIKPANTWLEASAGGKPGEFNVKILDFGLARSNTEKTHLTQSGVIIGTPAYMSPEQGRGETLDARSDLWSLGVVLYHMCTGDLPFKGEDALSTLLAVVTNHPRPPAQFNAEVPPLLSDLVMKLLEKDPAKRFASARDVADALRALEQVQPAIQAAAPYAPPDAQLWGDLGQSAQPTQVIAATVASAGLTPQEAAADANAVIVKTIPIGKGVGRKRGSTSWLKIGGALAAAVIIVLGVVVYGVQSSRTEKALAEKNSSPRGGNVDPPAAKNEPVSARPDSGKENAEAHYRHGLAKLDKKDAFGALLDFSKAIQADPKYVPAYTKRAAVNMDIKDLNKAIQDYTKVIALSPRDSAARVQRGLALLANRDINKAGDDFNMAIQLQADNAPAHHWLGVIWSSKKDHDQAIAEFTEAVRLDPQLAAAYYERGQAWMAAKKFGLAVQDFHAAIAKSTKEEVQLRRKIAAALNFGPQASGSVDDLIQLLGDPDTDVRKRAAIALGGIGKVAESSYPALLLRALDRKEVHDVRLEAMVALALLGKCPAALAAAPRLIQLLGDPAESAKVRERALWALRVHGEELLRLDGLGEACLAVLAEPKNPSAKMLRFDSAYMLAMLQGPKAGPAVTSHLVEFLKDANIKIVVSKKSAPGFDPAAEGSVVAEDPKNDGRVMAVEALEQLGPGIASNVEIMAQLQSLANGQKTDADLRDMCKELLKKLSK